MAASRPAADLRLWHGKARYFAPCRRQDPQSPRRHNFWRCGRLSAPRFSCRTKKGAGNMGRTCPASRWKGHEQEYPLTQGGINLRPSAKARFRKTSNQMSAYGGEADVAIPRCTSNPLTRTSTRRKSFPLLMPALAAELCSAQPTRGRCTRRHPRRQGSGYQASAPAHGVVDAASGKSPAIAFANWIVRMVWAMMANGEPAMRVERLQCARGACATGAAGRHGRRLYHWLPSPHLKARTAARLSNYC